MDQAESLGTAAGVLTTYVLGFRPVNPTGWCWKIPWVALRITVGFSSSSPCFVVAGTDTPCPGHSGYWDATFLSLRHPWASRRSGDLANRIRKLKTQLILAAHQHLSDAKTNLPYWHIRQYLSVWQQTGYTSEKQDSEKAVTREMGLRWEESD